MLTRLLALMAAGGENWSVASLARALDVPPPLVEELLARLARDGYLVCATMGEGASPCSRCSVRQQCHTGEGAALWQLSEKGRRLQSSKQRQRPDARGASV